VRRRKSTSATCSPSASPIRSPEPTTNDASRPDAFALHVAAAEIWFEMDYTPPRYRILYEAPAMVPVTR
jgi:hypothetical protein